MLGEEFGTKVWHLVEVIANQKKKKKTGCRLQGNTEQRYKGNFRMFDIKMSSHYIHYGT